MRASTERCHADLHNSRVCIFDHLARSPNTCPCSSIIIAITPQKLVVNTTMTFIQGQYAHAYHGSQPNLSPATPAARSTAAATTTPSTFSSGYNNDMVCCPTATPFNNSIFPDIPEGSGVVTAAFWLVVPLGAMGVPLSTPAATTPIAFKTTEAVPVSQ